MSQSLVSIRNLRTCFFLDEGTIHAVDGVNLEIPEGKTVGLVGESGCGKSVTAYSILRLISPPGKIVSGEIFLNRQNQQLALTDLKEDGKTLREIRGKEIAMIFQEPMSSLSPVHPVGDQIREAVELHSRLRGNNSQSRVLDMLQQVGIPDPETRCRQFPHELSGGLRQRAMIAMALCCRPRLLIADEPTTALDVTIQAQILELMRTLQQEIGMAILLITHDLGVVAEMADEVNVMYLGRIVETGDTKSVFDRPLHPYTKALLRSIPGRGTKRKSRLNVISGSVPDPFQSITGCPFHPRCDECVKGLCDQGPPPELIEVLPGHPVSCTIRKTERTT